MTTIDRHHIAKTLAQTCQGQNVGTEADDALMYIATTGIMPQADAFFALMDLAYRRRLVERDRGQDEAVIRRCAVLRSAQCAILIAAVAKTDGEVVALWREASTLLRGAYIVVPSIPQADEPTPLCEYEDCDQDRAPGATLCLGHIADNVREDEVQHARASSDSGGGLPWLGNQQRIIAHDNSTLLLDIASGAQHNLQTTAALATCIAAGLAIMNDSMGVAMLTPAGKLALIAHDLIGLAKPFTMEDRKALRDWYGRQR